MDDLSDKERILFLSRLIPPYRLPVLEQLDQKTQAEVVLVCSKEKIPGEKASGFSGRTQIQTICPDYMGAELRIAGRHYPFGCFKGLYGLLAGIKPSVIVLEGESNILNNIIVFLYGKRHSVPYLWWSCGRVRNTPESRVRKLLKPLLAVLIRNAAGILGYSSYACRYFETEYGVPEKRTFLACNSISTPLADKKIHQVRQKGNTVRASLGISETAPVILYVGAVVRDKNPDVFFSLFQKVKSRMPDVHAIFIGGGDALESIRQMAGGEADFHILGPVHEGVEAYFLAANLFIMPGLGGLALQQAMMCGLPAVCSVADGTELDLVKGGENGYFLEAGSSMDEWVQVIESILADPVVQKRMGERSREIIDTTFNSDLMTDRILEGIKQALESR